MSAARLKKIFNAVTALALMTSASMAFAHAHLQQSTPAAESTVKGANELRLVFSEGVEEGFTDVDISHDSTPVVVSSIKTDPQDKKVLIVTLTQPLPTGQYSVKWKAVSVDTHKSEGHYSFTVGN